MKVPPQRLKRSDRHAMVPLQRCANQLQPRDRCELVKLAITGAAVTPMVTIFATLSPSIETASDTSAKLKNPNGSIDWDGGLRYPVLD